MAKLNKQGVYECAGCKRNHLLLEHAIACEASHITKDDHPTFNGQWFEVMRLDDKMCQKCFTRPAVMLLEAMPHKHPAEIAFSCQECLDELPQPMKKLMRPMELSTYDGATGERLS